MILTSLDKYRNFGLLILRLGLGYMFIRHGWPKMMGGPDAWVRYGDAMAEFGIEAFPAFWGFMAAFAELAGGACLMAGFAFRPACMMLTFTMLVAALTKLGPGGSLLDGAHPIEVGIVFLSLIFIGPGRFSLDQKFKLTTRAPGAEG